MQHWLENSSQWILMGKGTKRYLLNLTKYTSAQALGASFAFFLKEFLLITPTYTSYSL